MGLRSEKDKSNLAEPALINVGGVLLGWLIVLLIVMIPPSGGSWTD